MKNLLIIDQSRHNWFEVFDGATVEGEDVQVDQADWRKVNLTAHTQKGAIVELSPADSPIPGSPQHDYRKFEPDFLFFRKPHKSLLYGFAIANIPSVNSLESIYMNLERPLMFAGLVGIVKRLGFEKFPLIEQYYFPNYLQMSKVPRYPVVLKVGAAHAGFGKIKLDTRHQFEDFVSVMALYQDYVTAEPFIEADYDFRIQKIGNKYRGLKRKSIYWKANTGASVMEEMPVSDKHKLWADECSNLFGGMDILALDALHTKDGEELIIELNDSAIGFPSEFQAEDMQSVKDVILARMKELY